MPAAFLVALAAQAATASPPPSPPPPAPPGLFDGLFGKSPDLPDSSAEQRAGRDDLNLVVVRSGPFTLSESLSLYRTERGWCAPVSPLFDALGVDHREEDGELVATLHEPRRSHRLALASLETTPEGRCVPLSDAGRLAEAALAYDPVEQSLSVDSDPPVPARARLEREGSRKSRQAGDGTPAPTYPELENPTRWAAIPTVDAALSVGVAGGRFVGTALVEGAGDLFHSTARWRVATSTAAAPQLRGKIERVAPDGGMLGALDARRIEVGDVGLPAQPMIGAALQGRGLIVSSAPEWRADIFDRLVLSGPLPDGWQAELSLGGRLIAFVDAPDAAGEYRFTDVPVRVGSNDFVIDLYGPHGEHVRRSAARQVGSARYPENEASITFGLIAPVARGDDQGPAVPATAIASTSAGIADWASGRVDVRRALGGSASAASVSVDASLLGGVAGATIAKRRPGGWAGSALLSRRLGPMSLTAEAREFGPRPGLWADVDEAALRRLADLRIDGSVSMFGRPVGLSFDLRRTTDRIGIGRTGLRAQQAMRFGAFRFDHQMTAEFGSSGRTTGVVALGWGRRKASLRFRAGYRLAPVREVTDLSLAADTQAGDWSLRAQASYDPSATSARVSLGASRQFGPFDVSFDGGWNSGPTAMAGLRVALGSLPGEGLRALPAGSSRGGLLVPRVSDADGRPVAKGRFLVANTLRKEETGNNGMALIGPVAAYRPTDLALQISSLDDDRLRPVSPGVAVAARPGQILAIPVKLQRTGSIEVRLVRRAGDRVDPLVGVKVVVTDPAGVSRSALSDFDGFALVDAVPLGRYAIEASFDGVSARETILIDRRKEDATTTMIL